MLRGKGRRGVNVTFYLLIFHTRGGWRGEEAELVQEEENGGFYDCVWIFLPSWSDIAAPSHTPTHTRAAVLQWDADGWARSEEALLGRERLIVCNHPCPTFTSVPNQFLINFMPLKEIIPAKWEHIRFDHLCSSSRN